jgi:hypothetical protein
MMFNSDVGFDEQMMPFKKSYAVGSGVTTPEPSELPVPSRGHRKWKKMSGPKSKCGQASNEFVD